MRCEFFTGVRANPLQFPAAAGRQTIAFTRKQITTYEWRSWPWKSSPETEESGKNHPEFHRRGHRGVVPGNDRPHPFPAGAKRLPAHGHRKALTIDFGTAEKYNGLCNACEWTTPTPRRTRSLWRPSSRRDIHWLGFDFRRHRPRLRLLEEDYRQAVLLIKKRLAYVCQLTPGNSRPTAEISASQPCVPLP